jgi:two-component system response regulator FlrC
LDLKQREWEMILSTIRDVRGSRKATAERLGISQRTLRYKLARMREAGIMIPDQSGMETA